MTIYGPFAFGDIRPADKIHHALETGDVMCSTVSKNEGAFVKTETGFTVWPEDIVAVNSRWLIPAGRGKFSLVDE